MAQFYCVVGNRDTLKVRMGDEVVARPITDFIEGQEHWLTSLVYLRGMKFVPPGHRFFDCGAWSYKNLAEPKWSPQECIEKYAAVANDGDIVAAPDHMVLRDHNAQEEAWRIDLTLKNADVFLRECPRNLVPVAVTHGHTVEGRIEMTKRLLDMGYRYIAAGSVAIRAGNRKFIGHLLEETVRLREQQDFKIHVLGVSAPSWVRVYEELGIDSYDGSSMFFAAFTGAEYYWFDGARLTGHSVKGITDPSHIPMCDCAACSIMRAQDIDTRLMGSNENNMGRATHNVNMYLRAIRTGVHRSMPVQARLLD